MAEPPDLKTVLFWDIDGTLLSTGRAGILALEDAARELLGVETDFDRLQTAGLTDAEVARLAIETAGAEPSPETVARFLRAYERNLPDRLPLREGRVLGGVYEILSQTHDRDAIMNLLLTGNTEAGAAAKLGHYGLAGFFDGGAFSLDGCSREEIAYRALDVAVERTDDPDIVERAFVIGDTPADVRCGKAMGARTVAVASGGFSAAELTDSDPWLVLDELPPPERFLELLGVPAV